MRRSREVILLLIKFLKLRIISAVTLIVSLIFHIYLHYPHGNCEKIEDKLFIFNIYINLSTWKKLIFSLPNKYKVQCNTVYSIIWIELACLKLCLKHYDKKYINIQLNIWIPMPVNKISRIHRTDNMNRWQQNDNMNRWPQNWSFVYMVRKHNMNKSNQNE